MRRLRIGMAQINTTVGDFQGNTEKMLEAVPGQDRWGSTSLLSLSWPPVVIPRKTCCSSRGSSRRTCGVWNGS